MGRKYNKMITGVSKISKLIRDEEKNFKREIDDIIYGEFNYHKILDLCNKIYLSDKYKAMFYSNNFTGYRNEISLTLSSLYYENNIEDANILHIRLYEKCCTALYMIT